jgi:protein-disulfide isomerase
MNRLTARKRHVATLVAIALVLSVLPTAAQPADELKALRQELEALKQGQSTIQRDVQEIKELLRARPAAPQAARPPAATPPRDIALDLTGAPVKGAPAAKLVMVEYTDYQ